jgi:hypothetical protein
MFPVQRLRMIVCGDIATAHCWQFALQRCFCQPPIHLWLQQSAEHRLHGTKSTNRTKHGNGNEKMGEGVDKTSIDLLAPSVPAVLCAIKQAPSAIASPANTPHCVHSLAAHAISLALLPPSSLMM